MADLVTLEEFKEYKGLKNPTDDGKNQLLVSFVSSLIENYCNRKFKDYVLSDFTEWFDSKTDVVTLSGFPLISVTSVNISSDGGVTQTLLSASSPIDYFVDIENGQVRTTVSGITFNSNYNTPYRSLEISYKYGYSDIPSDLKLAVFDTIDYYRDNKNVPSMNLAGASIDNPQPYIANSFPPHIRRILDLYRYSI